MDTDGTEVKHVEGLKITVRVKAIVTSHKKSSDMVLFSDKLQDGILQEELQQRTLKIERLFRHGLQHSSNVIVPEERIGDDPLSSSTDPLEIEAEAREAEKVFQETLANVMQQKQLPQYLFQLLQQRQSETSAILKHYDDIISMMKKDMNDQDKEYRNRMEKQSDLRELLQARTEDFVSELIRVGNEEIAAAREAIINHTDKSSKEIYAKTQQFLDDTSADQPFDPRSWKAPSDMLTFGTLKDVFISSQEDIFQSRNKSLSKICGQRKDLEKEKLDYALERENLDRELFDMRSEYRSDMPALVATKGQITKSADRKRALSRQLRRLHREIEKAEEELRKISSSFAEKRSRIGRPVKTNINKCCSKENRVLEMKRLEVNELVDEILEMYEYVWEGMCGRSLQSLDFSGAMTAEEHRKIHRMSDLKNVLPLVPHDIMLSEVLKLMEEYRKLMLDHHELSTLKQGLRLQNSELLVLLKCYHAHRNSS